MFKSLKNLLELCAVVAVVLPVAASADMVFLASSHETLYRVTPEREIESWDFPGIKLRGMHRDPAGGEIYVLGDEGGGTPATVYMLHNGFSGTPTLTEYCELSRLYGSLTEVGGVFYAFHQSGLYALDISDPASPIETLVGDTEISGAAGSAYDPDSGTFYMLSFRHGDGLFTVDLEAASANLIGFFGIDADDLGAEWYHGGLYAAMQNRSSGCFEIGVVDPESGLYSALYTVASGVDYVATGLTVVPEPSAFGMLLLAAFGLFSTRRR
jgi:hypothetical protein